MIKNSRRTFLALNRKKNMDIKAWQKKGCSYKKKVYASNGLELKRRIFCNRGVDCTFWHFVAFELALYSQ